MVFSSVTLMFTVSTEETKEKNLPVLEKFIFTIFSYDFMFPCKIFAQNKKEFASKTFTLHN